jgi:hypothetical protein
VPTITLPELHSGQVTAYGTPGRFRVLRCGRRWGKTLYGSTIICDGVARGESWGLFAPEYKFTAETYREIDETLDPIKKSGSKVDGVIHAISKGRVDFWTLNNPNAGRSRRYHGVIIDEAAFAGNDMQAIWEKSIQPALLDYRGVAWVLSTPSGKDEENWFYNICNDPALGFVEYHAPTATNPFLPAEEIERLRLTSPPDVWRQEYLAEFVDWSGVAFFLVEYLLVGGKPVPMPTRCDTVFAVIDTSVKSGKEHDSTAAIWFAYDSLNRQQPGVILDWTILQIEGAHQATWLPTIHARGEELAEQCGARFGYSGAMIEDKATGTVLIQQSQNEARQQGRRALAFAIDSKLTAAGKDERAIATSPYIYGGKIKITEQAFDKTMVLKGRTANHLLMQVTGFRVGRKGDPADDLFDCFCYGTLGICAPNAGERRMI